MEKDKVNRGSIASKIIEKAWKVLQSNFEDLPNVVVVLLSIEKKHWTLGHFAPACWTARGRYSRSELGISPSLFHSPKEILAVLLHEATHAVLWKRGIKSVGSGGYYHLKSFRDCCRNEFFLKCEFHNTRYGFSETSLDKNSLKYYKKELKVLHTLPSGTGKIRAPKARWKKLPKPGHILLYCKCDDPRLIRSTPVNFQKGNIICGVCKSDFEPEIMPQKEFKILDFFLKAKK